MSESNTAQSLENYYRWHSLAYDWTRWAFLFGRKELLDLLVSRPRPQRVLEVGCGTGTNLARLASMFPDAEIVGLDLSAEMLRRARKKTAVYGPRVALIHGAYQGALSPDAPFDLIVFSYCLSMINPGFAELLRLCRQDLQPTGTLAIVDFHDSYFGWFRRWMGMNHVRMDGQILAELEASGMLLKPCEVRSAYGGWWRWMICLAKHSQRTVNRLH